MAPIQGVRLGHQLNLADDRQTRHLLGQRGDRAADQRPQRVVLLHFLVAGGQGVEVALSRMRRTSTSREYRGRSVKFLPGLFITGPLRATDESAPRRLLFGAADVVASSLIACRARRSGGTTRRPVG